MQRHAAAAVLLMLIAPFAGCLGAEPNAAASSSPSGSASAATTDMVGTTSPPGPANTPPEGSFGSAVHDAAPLAVNFTLNGTDADGDALSWTLDANGDGEADREGSNATFPVLTNYTYESAGLYNVTYVLSDGQAEASYNLTLNLTAGVATTPQVNYKFTGKVTGTWNPGTGYSGTDVFHPFKVTDNMAAMVAAINEGDTAPDLDYALIDPAGQVAANAIGTFPVDGTEEPDLRVEYPVLGEWKVRVRAGLAVEGTYTIDVTFS